MAAIDQKPVPSGILSSAGRHPPQHSRSITATLCMADTMSSRDMPSLSSILLSSCLLMTSFTLTAGAPGSSTTGALAGSTLMPGWGSTSFSTFKGGDDTLLPSTLMILITMQFPMLDRSTCSCNCKKLESVESLEVRKCLCAVVCLRRRE
jgi:hypothetical protein